MEARRKRLVPTTPLVWPLVKVAALWFLLAEAATILANIFDMPAAPFAYVAAVAFVFHSAGVWLAVGIADGVSLRLALGVACCFVLSIAIFSNLRLTQSEDVHDIATRVGRIVQNFGGRAEDTSRFFASMRPVEHLAAAAKLVFENETPETLAEARQHLYSIPELTEEYRSAQALLRVAETRLNELRLQEGSDAGKQPQIQIIAREQTTKGLRIILRNNGNKPIRNIRYHIAYFRAVDGWHIEPDKESRIDNPILPRQTSTLQISDNLLNGLVFYASIALVGWEVVP